MTNLAFEHIPIIENNDPMVNLSEYPFELAPMYYKWSLSDTPVLWTRKAISEMLLEIQKKELESKDLKFKIWDPWRSRIVQNNIYQKFWNELKAKHPNWDDSKLTYEVGVFVTKSDNPNRIPPHATGGSIDLTITDLDGKEIDFGTAFDHFGPEAASDYYEHNDDNIAARDNRRWLHQIMSEGGFELDPDEWWHFDYGNQKWAVQLGKTAAFYGEIIDPIVFKQKPTEKMKHVIS